MTAESIVSLPCPKCGWRLDVKDSRPARFRGGNSIRRRRRCKKCGHRVTTLEVISDGDDFAHSKLPRIIATARQAKSALDAMINVFDTDEEKK